VVRHFAFGLVARFSRRSRFAAGICSGLGPYDCCDAQLEFLDSFDWALLLHSLL
jgi:hypothetical protein